MEFGYQHLFHDTDCIVIFIDIPILPGSKSDVIVEFFQNTLLGNIGTCLHVHVPLKADKQFTQGYAYDIVFAYAHLLGSVLFVEMDSVACAKQVVRVANGITWYSANAKLRCERFKDYNGSTMSETNDMHDTIVAENNTMQTNYIDQALFQNQLLDPNQFDHTVIMNDADLEIFLGDGENDSVGDPEETIEHGNANELTFDQAPIAQHEDILMEVNQEEDILVESSLENERSSLIHSHFMNTSQTVQTSTISQDLSIDNLVNGDHEMLQNLVPKLLVENMKYLTEIQKQSRSMFDLQV